MYIIHTTQQNVKTQVSVNKYDINNYILYYDTTDIQNFIIVSKSSFPLYFFAMIHNLFFIFGLVMMCMLFLFLQ